MGESLKELEETLYWLELLAESDVIKPAMLTPLQNETHGLIAFFITIIKKVKANSLRNS
jgi:four helix bundle protein